MYNFYDDVLSISVSTIIIISTNTLQPIQRGFTFVVSPYLVFNT